MSTSTQVPVARSENLVVEELGDELLVYDQSSDRAHSLGAEAARVWRACDGEATAATLGARLDLDGATVERALDELGACGLLDGGATAERGMTRRDMTVRTAKVGAAAASAPLIWSIAVSPASAAATPTVEFCLQGQTTQGCGEQCTKGRCGCCCCQSIPANLRPAACKAETKCCLPPTQCATVFKGNCSSGPFGPPVCTPT